MSNLAGDNTGSTFREERSAMGPVWAIAMKDLRQLGRDRANAFFTFGFPVLLSMFFGFVFGGAGGDSLEMDVVIVREGASASVTDGVERQAVETPADAFVRLLDADEAIRVHIVAGREQGEQLVRTGKAVACLILPSDFDPQRAIMQGGIKLSGDVDPKRTAEVGLLSGKLTQLAFSRVIEGVQDPERLRSMVDQARSGIRSGDLPATQKLLFEAVFNSLEGLAKSRAGGREVGGESLPSGWQPVTLDLTPLQAEGRKSPRAFELSFPQGVVWGLMGCVTAFAAGFAEERNKGTLKRLSVAPLSGTRVLLGKALACFIACVAVQALLLVVAHFPPFRVVIARPMLVGPVLLLNAVGFTGVMMALAGMARTVGGSMGMSRAAILVLAMIGGGTIPIFFMPKAMEYVSNLSPFKWATLAIEGALWRQFTWGEMMFPGAVLLGFGVVGYAVGSMSLKRWAMN